MRQNALAPWSPDKYQGAYIQPSYLVAAIRTALMLSLVTWGASFFGGVQAVGTALVGNGAPHDGHRRVLSQEDPTHGAQVLGNVTTGKKKEAGLLMPRLLRPRRRRELPSTDRNASDMPAKYVVHAYTSRIARGQAIDDVRARMGSSHRRCQRGSKCLRMATYGSNVSRVLMACSDHKNETEIELRNRRCKHCDKQALFGDPISRQARFCGDHRTEMDVNLRNKRCEAEGGCWRQPFFGDLDEGVARFCRTHKALSHVDVRSRKCEVELCNKQPSYGFRGDSYPTVCKQHMLHSQIRLRGKTCRQEGCLKQPTFGRVTDMVYRSCSKHRESDEVNLRKEKELQRLALFNAPVALVRRAQTLRREFSLRSASDGVAPAVSGESMEAASHHDRGAPAQAQAGSRMAQRPGASESL